MRNHVLLSSAMTAWLLLFAMAGIASANRLSINDRDLSLVWTELTFESAGTFVTCPVVLNGSFHNVTINKTLRSLIGVITSAEVGTCTGGSVTVLTATLPWHVAYNGFTGRLPTITSVRLILINASFQIASTATCLVRTDTTEPSGATANVEASGGITSVTADATFEIDLDTPGFLCDLAGDGQISGSGIVVVEPDADTRDHRRDNGRDDRAVDPDTDIFDDDATRDKRAILRLI